MSTSTVDTAARAQMADLGLARRELISTGTGTSTSSALLPPRKPRKPTANIGAWAGYNAPADDQSLLFEDLDDGQAHRRARLVPGRQLVHRKDVDMTFVTPEQAQAAAEARRTVRHQKLEQQHSNMAIEATKPNERPPPSSVHSPLTPASNHTGEPETFRLSPDVAENQVQAQAQPPAQQQLQPQPQGGIQSQAADVKKERGDAWTKSVSHLGTLDSSKWAEKKQGSLGNSRWA